MDTKRTSTPPLTQREGSPNRVMPTNTQTQTQSGEGEMAEDAVEAVARLRSEVARLTEELNASKRRESALQLALVSRERDVARLRRALDELREGMNPHFRQMRLSLSDPAVNAFVRNLKSALTQSNTELRKAREDLEAAQYSSQSSMGKKLVAKCRALREENEELGRRLAEGKVHRLKCELALTNEYAKDLKKALDESDSFVLQLSNEIGTMEGNLFQLQTQLAFASGAASVTRQLDDATPDREQHTDQIVHTERDRHRHNEHSDNRADANQEEEEEEEEKEKAREDAEERGRKLTSLLQRQRKRKRSRDRESDQTETRTHDNGTHWMDCDDTSEHSKDGNEDQKGEAEEREERRERERKREREDLSPQTSYFSPDIGISRDCGWSHLQIGKGVNDKESCDQKQNQHRAERDKENERKVDNGAKLFTL